MHALALLFTVVAAFGLAYIVGFSLISLPFRSMLARQEWLGGESGLLLAMLECPACFGFWTGLVAFGMSDLSPVDFHGPSLFQNLLRGVVGGCFISGSNYLLALAAGMTRPVARTQTDPAVERAP